MKRLPPETWTPFKADKLVDVPFSCRDEWGRDVAEALTPLDAFGWLDDGKHHVKCEINGIDLAELQAQNKTSMTVDEVADAVVQKLSERLAGKRPKKAGR